MVPTARQHLSGPVAVATSRVWGLRPASAEFQELSGATQNIFDEILYQALEKQFLTSLTPFSSTLGRHTLYSRADTLGALVAVLAAHKGTFGSP